MAVLPNRCYLARCGRDHGGSWSPAQLRDGPAFVREARQRIYAINVLRWRPFWATKWHLDEVFLKINGVTHYLWRSRSEQRDPRHSYTTKSGSVPLYQLLRVAGRKLRVRNSHQPTPERDRQMRQFR